MPLTERQQSALEALDWLLDDHNHRQEGRTTVFAIALIRAALRQPLHWIEVCPLTYADQRIVTRHLWSTVKDLVARDHNLNGVIVFDERRLYLMSRERAPIRDWLPYLPERPYLIDREVTPRKREVREVEYSGPRISPWERIFLDGDL